MAAPKNPRDFCTWTCLNSRCQAPDILGGDQVGMNQNYGHQKEEAGKKDVSSILRFLCRFDNQAQNDLQLYY